jgi:ferrous-iron efflux pump FieF
VVCVGVGNLADAERGTKKTDRMVDAAMVTATRDAGEGPRDRLALRLTIATIAGSAGMAALLVAVYWLFASQLALAQAADSISDLLGGGALLWAVRLGAAPPDEDHPHGHRRAEPIAALVVAVLAGVLSIEVLRAAILALIEGAAPELDVVIAMVFVLKVALKGAILAIAARAVRTRKNPAIDALRVDARNDVLVGSVAVVGFGLARAGMPIADAILAIAVAIYVGVSAIGLARDNIALLIGESAPTERREELEAMVQSIGGVRGVDALVATWFGARLHVHVEIAVDPSLTIADAHEIGHAVEERIAREEDVERAVVHVGPAG